MRQKKRLMIVALGLAVAAAAAALAAAAVFDAAPVYGGKPLGTFFLGKNLARAEAVVVVRGAVHDYRIDRGRIRAVGNGSLDLRETDGSRQTVQVAPSAIVKLNGLSAAFIALRPGMVAVTIRDGSAPADSVQAFTR